MQFVIGKTKWQIHQCMNNSKIWNKSIKKNCTHDTKKILRFHSISTN